MFTRDSIAIRRDATRRKARHGRARPRIGIPHLINHRYICANTTAMHSQGSRHFRIPIFIARHEPCLVIDLPRESEYCFALGCA